MGKIECYFLQNLDHLKRFPDVPFHKRAVKTWQNISFYSHSVGAQPLPPSSLEQTGVWLAVNEDGLNVLDYTMHPFATYPYQSVITFGGCKEDFMLVVSQIKDQALGSKTGDKLLYAMTKPKILELTLLMACYINYWTSSLPGARNQNQVSAVSLMETGSSGTSTAITSP